MTNAPAPELEFIMAIQLEMRMPLHDIGPLPTGGRRWSIGVEGGTFSGPNLNGEVLPGGEWPLFRPDGVLAINARYCLREDDGTIIYLQNRGFRWARTPEAFEKWRSGAGGTTSEDFYMRVVPTFEAPEGPHDWLTRHVIVGVLGDGDPAARGPFIRYYKLL